MNDLWFIGRSADCGFRPLLAKSTPTIVGCDRLRGAQLQTLEFALIRAFLAHSGQPYALSDRPWSGTKRSLTCSAPYSSARDDLLLFGPSTIKLK